MDVVGYFLISWVWFATAFVVAFAVWCGRHSMDAKDAAMWNWFSIPEFWCGILLCYLMYRYEDTDHFYYSALFIVISISVNLFLLIYIIWRMRTMSPAPIPAFRFSRYFEQRGHTIGLILLAVFSSPSSALFVANSRITTIPFFTLSFTQAEKIGILFLRVFDTILLRTIPMTVMVSMHFAHVVEFGKRDLSYVWYVFLITYWVQVMIALIFLCRDVCVLRPFIQSVLTRRCQGARGQKHQAAQVSSERLVKMIMYSEQFEWYHWWIGGEFSDRLSDVLTEQNSVESICNTIFYGNKRMPVDMFYIDHQLGYGGKEIHAYLSINVTDKVFNDITMPALRRMNKDKNQSFYGATDIRVDITLLEQQNKNFNSLDLEAQLAQLAELPQLAELAHHHHDIDVHVDKLASLNDKIDIVGVHVPTELHGNDNGNGDSAGADGAARGDVVDISHSNKSEELYGGVETQATETGERTDDGRSGNVDHVKIKQDKEGSASIINSDGNYTLM